MIDFGKRIGDQLSLENFIGPVRFGSSIRARTIGHFELR